MLAISYFQSWVVIIQYLFHNSYSSCTCTFYLLPYMHVIFHKKNVLKYQVHSGYCVSRQVCKWEVQLSSKDMMEAWTRVEK